jgi:hypothetical protein
MTMNRPNNPLSSTRFGADLQRIQSAHEMTVVDLHATAQPGPVVDPLHSNPVAAELELTLLSELSELGNPGEAAATSALLRDYLLDACPTERVDWELAAHAYVRILRAAVHAPRETQTQLGIDAASVLGAAPDAQIRTQANVVLALARGLAIADTASAALDFPR